MRKTILNSLKKNRFDWKFQFKLSLIVLLFLSFIPEFVNAQISPQNRVIVGYFHNWNNASSPYIRLRDVNPKYNVINIAFATPVSHGDMTMTFTPTMQSKAEFISDIRALQAQGRRVQISIGGADAPIELHTTADKDKFVTTMKAIITEYGFDGYDIDLEGTSVILNSGDNNFKSPTTPKISNLISASREIINYFRGQGKDFWLTSAPEVQYVQGGYANYGTAYGGYLPVLYGLRDLLNFVHVQYYNTGSQNALDDKIYSQGTADFIVSMTDMLLRGFPVARNAANVFPALREDQVAFGLPATGTGAAPAGGFVPHAEVTKALNYLVKGISYGSQYVLPKTYPGLRGIMTWSVNWDKTQGDAFANNAYNFFSTLGGTNPPPSVSLASPSNGATYNVPATINIAANASDNGNVTQVAFYNGGTLLGTDASSPYTFNWTNVPAGNYSITARATDNEGATATSTAVNVTVNGTTSGAPIPGTIQAESYSAMSGIQTETTTDTNGGQNVGYVEAGDWMDYLVNVATTGAYTVGFRVASQPGGGQFQLRNSGGTSLATVNVSATGGWQSWTTVNATVNLNAGTQTLRVYATAAGWNLNWMQFGTTNTCNPTTITPHLSINGGPWQQTSTATLNVGGSVTMGPQPSTGGSWSWSGPSGFSATTREVTRSNMQTNQSGNYVATYTNSCGTNSTHTFTITVNSTGTGTPIPGTVQAENYSAMNGIQTETTTDTGGGTNVGWIEAGDWMDYNANVASTGTYNVAFRVASEPGGGQLQLRSGSTVLTTVNVPATGGWQVWTTLNATVNLNAGVQALRLHASASGFNVNWMEFTISTTTNTPPTVNLTAPANGTTYSAPATINITAGASDVSPGIVSKVEFFNGVTKLGEDTSSPYTYSWTNVAAGAYTITARATDNQGATATSQGLSVTVNGNTGNCSGKPNYVENGGYVAGSQVQNDGSVYECKPYPYSGWCNGASWAYEPGAGTYWADAWTLIGPCSGARLVAPETKVSSRDLSVYPNPVIEGNTLNIDLDSKYHVVKISIQGISGGKIHTYTFKNTNSIQLNLPSLPKGLGVMKVKAGDREWTRKVLFQ